MRELFLILHLLGMALGVGVSFAHLFLGRARSRMTKEDAQKDALRGLSLVIMANIGITLLILSGLFLMSPYWSILFHSPYLMIKLSLVILLVIALVIINIKMRKAQKMKGGPVLLVIKKLGKLTLLLSVTIVILAVLMFQ